VGVDSRASWAVALTALGIYTVSFGAPYITVVALKPIAAELGSARSVPALAFALAWLGSAVGGIGMVSRWFDRRRGSAMALISSGNYLAGAIWSTPFERAIASFGWHRTMLIYALFEIAVIVPAALIMFGQAPETAEPAPLPGSATTGWVLGLRPWVVQSFLCLAGFLCCVPMAMPQGHLVAFCSDIGIPGTHGAAMLSVLLGCAFLARVFWGAVTDRIGGLRTVFAGSVCQITAMIGFLLTQDEAGLFAVAAAFGLGFSGIIPAYVVAVRELFPAAEASWRIPTLLLFSGSGMAAGGWLAALIYDHAGFYGAAFAAGIVANFVHIIVIGTLVLRRQ
jgi:MFS family permease